MLRPRPNWIRRFFLKAILLFIFFATFNVRTVQSEEPSVVNDRIEKRSQTSTLAYLTGIAGILISLGVGYRLRRVYDTRKDELAG